MLCRVAGPRRTPLHSDQQGPGPRAPPGLYLTPLCFNTNSPERKSCPFGGGGFGKSGLCCSGAQPTTHGWADCPLGRGRWHQKGQCGPAAKCKVCSSVGALSSQWWGAVQGPVMQKEVEPLEAASGPHVLCPLSQRLAHSIQSRQRSEETQHGHPPGKEGQFQGGTEAPMVHNDRQGRAPRHLEKAILPVVTEKGC